jgi:hypothetical protein
VAYPVATPGETPINVQIGATNPTGTTFKTTFIVNRNAVPFKPVYVSRTDCQTGLIRTLIFTNIAILYYQMAFFINLEAIEK